jgi:peptidoglycan/LPS O-acetylase OafA/YrhL
LIQIAVFAFALATFEGWNLLPRLDWFLARSPVLRVWEFLIGCTLGAIFLKARADARLPGPLRLLAHQTRRHTVLAGCFLIILSIIFLPLPGGRWGLLLDGLKDFVLFTPVFATIILACAIGPTLLSRVLDHPLLVLLGEASYALYITHWIFVMLFQRVIPGGRSLAVEWYILGILVSIIISVGFYFAIELPLRRVLRPRRSLHPRSSEHLGDRQYQDIVDSQAARY